MSHFPALAVLITDLVIPFLEFALAFVAAQLAFGWIACDVIKALGRN